MNNSQITNLLHSILNSKNINLLSNQLNLNQVDTKNIMMESLPKILNGLNSNILDPKGMNQLYQTLDKHLGIDFSDGISFQEGQKILNHIFSNPNQVASQISKNTGSNKNETLGVLSGLAPIVMGILGDQKSHGAGKNDIAKLINGLTVQANSGLMLDIFDKNKNGKINDDIISMIIGFLKRFFVKNRK